MLQLRADDVLLLAEIAATRSQTQEERETLKETLLRGFEKYADDKLIEYFSGSREKMIRDRAEWLLENIDKAGQSSEQAFGSEAGRNAIIRILISLNVPKRNIEDLADEIVFKFWRHRHAEKYNPLRAPWGHHVRNAVRTCVASFWSSRTRQPDEIGVSIDQMRPQGGGAEDDMHLEPYEKDQTTQNPANLAMLAEFMQEFEQFLREEKPFRTSLFYGYKEVCTLLAPGTAEIPTEVPLDLYVRAKGRDSYRVVDPSWDESKSVMVSVDKLQSVEIRDPDGTTRISKSRPNRNYSEVGEATRIERTPYDVYQLLVKGLQVTEIAKNLNVGDSTAHNWVRRLEELFAEFWLISDMIPEGLRYQAEPIYKCPECGHLQDECGLCEIENCFETETVNGQKIKTTRRTSLKKMKKEIHRMQTFPWGSVRGNPDIKKRADKYRVGLSAQSCYM